MFKKFYSRLKNKWLLLYMSIGAVVILLNLLAWNSAAFCDAYIEVFFPVILNTYGRLTGIFPFSVGEIMLVLAVVLTVAALLVWLLAFVKKCRKHIKRYYLFYAWTFLIVCLVMTLNCFILYHASTFSENYFQENERGTLEELIAVRNMVVEQCNLLAPQMERDEKGAIVTTLDLETEAIACMQKLGGTYDRLEGYYPRPKPLAASDFFSQQHMCGYFFPFSMEANYNDVMYIMNKPATMCHELAHLKGYILEDEANFISYLACLQSEQPLVRYSGYLSVLNYLDNDFYKAIGRDNKAYFAQPIIDEQVRLDNIFVTDEEWERINGKALIDTETVDEVSDKVVDVTLKVNGVKDGMVSYNRVVELLLQYYSGKM